MDNKNKRSSIPLIAGAISGVTLGWVIRRSNHKRQKLEENNTLIEKIKGYERKVFEDGQKRASQIDGIKKEVQKKVTE
ncbi:hypothetical protein CIL05_19445 [Virgibacillus profundi]|uniref:Uncharacterized protein n=1 Tax=Virgibacillus profundi TaxID=2024555 RepID=A0A2A2I902_9BACI|nr:hypothetical protein [Virgibacillus profundi]PAV27858.1 hypothetical protein CIL05_19445 [Virgibacillus profundi]PXY52036.1 hypothetical protein CIT14_19550 [Virgibacillus profundi]